MYFFDCFMILVTGKILVLNQNNHRTGSSTNDGTFKSTNHSIAR